MIKADLGLPSMIGIDLLRVTAYELPDLGVGKRVLFRAITDGIGFYRLWIEGRGRTLEEKRIELMCDVEKYMRTGKLPPECPSEEINR